MKKKSALDVFKLNYEDLPTRNKKTKETKRISEPKIKRDNNFLGDNINFKRINSVVSHIDVFLRSISRAVDSYLGLDTSTKTTRVKRK